MNLQLSSKFWFTFAASRHLTFEKQHVRYPPLSHNSISEACFNLVFNFWAGASPERNSTCHLRLSHTYLKRDWLWLTLDTPNPWHLWSRVFDSFFMQLSHCSCFEPLWLIVAHLPSFFNILISFSFIQLSSKLEKHVFVFRWNTIKTSIKKSFIAPSWPTYFE